MSRFSGDLVVAWAEACRGPGWSNTPIWVLLRDPATGALRVECLQPEEQTEIMLALQPLSAVLSEQMTAAVAMYFARYGRD